MRLISTSQRRPFAPNLLWILPAAFVATALIGFVTESSFAKDGWVDKHDDQTGQMVRTKRLTIYPKLAPKPALKYRLIPDEFERVEGNAAVFYLKASGFLEQEPARRAIREFEDASIQKSREEDDGDLSQVAPWVWLDTPPHELPIPEVKKYLSLVAFQEGFLREAASRRKFDMDRQFRELNNPISYLLPEIQGLRDVARKQSIRCRLAIAEGRIDDAIEILQQQFALAEHLGQDEFLVSALVGIAISNIAWNDSLNLVQEKDAPNLYWALASMPRPLIDLQHANSNERQLLYQQVKVLREVTEKPRPAGYWQDFIDRLLPQLDLFAAEMNRPIPTDRASRKAALIAFIAASYPGAKMFLHEEVGMTKEQIDAYPTAQVVFLACKLHFERYRDEMFKWTYIPLWQARSKAAYNQVERDLGKTSEKYGWFTTPAQTLLPAITAVQNAQARGEQMIALLQTVEAVRMYAAEHDGELPLTLESLSVPAPIDPYTGKTITYERSGGAGILKGHPMRGTEYRLIITVAK